MVYCRTIHTLIFASLLVMSCDHQMTNLGRTAPSRASDEISKKPVIGADQNVGVLEGVLDTIVTKAPSKESTEKKSIFHFSCNHTAQCLYEVRLDQQEWHLILSSVYEVDVEVGEHQLEVRAVDHFENKDPSPIVVFWNVREGLLVDDFVFLGKEKNVTGSWSVATKSECAVLKHVEDLDDIKLEGDLKKGDLIAGAMVVDVGVLTNYSESVSLSSVYYSVACRRLGGGLWSSVKTRKVHPLRKPEVVSHLGGGVRKLVQSPQSAALYGVSDGGIMIFAQTESTIQATQTLTIPGLKDIVIRDNVLLALNHDGVISQWDLLKNPLLPEKINDFKLPSPAQTLGFQSSEKVWAFSEKLQKSYVLNWSAEGFSLDREESLEKKSTKLMSIGGKLWALGENIVFDDSTPEISIQNAVDMADVGQTGWVLTSVDGTCSLSLLIDGLVQPQNVAGLDCDHTQVHALQSGVVLMGGGLPQKISGTPGALVLETIGAEAWTSVVEVGNGYLGVKSDYQLEWARVGEAIQEVPLVTGLFGVLQHGENLYSWGGPSLLVANIIDQKIRPLNLTRFGTSVLDVAHHKTKPLIAVALDPGGVQVFDVQNPQQPLLLSTWHAEKRFWRVVWNENAVIATGPEALVHWNSQGEVLSERPLLGEDEGEHIVLTPDYLFHLGTNQELRVWGQPFQVDTDPYWHKNYRGSPRYGVWVNDSLYMADLFQGFLRWEIQEDDLIMVESKKVVGLPRKVHVFGDRSAFVVEPYGVHVFERSTSGETWLLDTWSLPGGVPSQVVAVSPEYAVVSDTELGLLLVKGLIED
ncbi:MAG: hypothetical protein AB8C84_08675 [Oligoflexales bacterium]